GGNECDIARMWEWECFERL
nr:Chain X, Phage-Derived Peptide Antagonist [synthetic construct]1KAT_Y Chain Y, Phage-Derived Peptide Antagonist [synthetic construct]